MTQLRDPLLPESHVACPDCGAPVGAPCRGIKVHPEYGPLGLHIARAEAARARREGSSEQPAEDEPTTPEPAAARGRAGGARG